ncbi:hypothetical protein CsNV_080 [Callinectes sapidus nudivirus]|nr:hypothetical protein CsNV_080 [Callinectes sapidus nudivirus]
MIHQRPITNKINNLSKHGYQAIELIGDRFVLHLINGKVENCIIYGKYNTNEIYSVSQKELSKIQEFVYSDEYLFDCTGYFELVFNSHYFKICDVILNEENIQNKTYSERLDFLYSKIKNCLLVEKMQVNDITSNVVVPTLYRNLNYAYQYGMDILITPIVNDNVYVIVGEAIETKENKILIQKKDYESIAKAPKVVKSKIGDLDELNKWKDELFNNERIPKVTKPDGVYAEVENSEDSHVLLIAGKCAVSGEIKIFGKVKKSSKFDCIIDTSETTTVKFDWTIDTNNFSDIKYYKVGYVISCATPRVVSKNLSHVHVFNVRQNVSLEKLDFVNFVDDIPTVQSQQIKRRLSTTPTKALVEELIARIWRSRYEGSKQLISTLNNFQENCDVQCINRKRTISESTDEEEQPTLKREKTEICD